MNRIPRGIFSSLAHLSQVVPRQYTCTYRTAYTIRMASTLPRLPIFEALHSHDASRTAIVHYPSGRSFTYGELVHDVANAAEELRIKADGKKLPGERVAFLVENGYDYVGALALFPIHFKCTSKYTMLMRCSNTLVHLRQPLNCSAIVHDLPRP